MDSLICLKLTTGQEVVGYVKNKNFFGDITLDKPMLLNMTVENAISLQPYMPYAKTQAIVFKRNQIFAKYPPPDNLTPVFDVIWNNMNNMVVGSLAQYNERINATKNLPQQVNDRQTAPQATPQKPEIVLIQPTDMRTMH
jgi:hypothetical protein